MGRDKALLTEAGSPLVIRVAATVAMASGRCSVVAPAGRYEGLGLPVLADLWPGEGPLGGILTALGSREAEWNLIVAVDLPLLDAAFLRELLAEARQGKEAIVSIHGNGALDPLCAVYPASAAGPLRQFFERGGRRVQDALREIEVRTVPAPARALTNVNTPEQWEAARG